MKLSKIILLTQLLICLGLELRCQSSFSLLISTPKDERIFDAAENAESNYFLVGEKYTVDPFEQNAYLLALNSSGEIIFEHEYCIEDTISFFGSVYYKNDSIIIFGAKGPVSTGLPNKLWILILDSDFNTLVDKTFYLSDYDLVDIETIINKAGNYILNGVIGFPSEEPDMLFFEISPTGDSVQRSIMSFDNGQWEFDLIEKNNGGYKVFAFGAFPGAPQTNGTIVNVDEAFNFISADSIPYRLYFNHSAKWLNDSNYLVTGNKGVYDANPYRRDIGIIKLDEDDNLIAADHFGKTGDTISYVGACSNLDVVSENSIYFGGASNFIQIPPMYQAEDSWLLLNNLDSNLNLNWQRFYGGDACYFLWGLKATQDGGCLMMATRYDENTQNQELDIFILKVDSNGLLTSTGDYPSIPVQQLAIFPNPAIDFITIRYPDIFGYDDKEIIIFNSLGNEMKYISATQNPTNTIVDIKNLPIGLYFAVLQVEGEKVATGKFLVVR